MTKLQVIPDAVLLTREEFTKLIRKYKHHRDLKFGFSKKHTEDIMQYRKSQGIVESSIPSNLYSMPVEWNVAESYIGY